jgi:CheY-like chemotaxis protein
MGGQVRYTPLFPGGSRFQIDLTLPEAPPFQAVKAQLEGAPRTYPGRRVLVLEDHPMNRMLLGTLLARRGITVVEASEGAKALEEVAKDPLDLAFLDLHLPGMDGFEVARQIRSRWGSGLALVACSAAVGESDKKEALVAGIQEFLEKPLVIADLDRVLERWLG